MNAVPSGTSADELSSGYLSVCGWLDDARLDGYVRLADDDGGWRQRGYPELAAAARAIARQLVGNGLRDGDGVCVVMPTDFTLIATMFGVWAAGGVLTLAPPPGFGDGDTYVENLGKIVTQAQPRLLITSSDLSDVMSRVVAISRPGSTGPIAELAITESNITQWVSCAEGLFQPDRLPQNSAIALVQFTSGSAGTPKGVQVLWSNLAANVAFIAKSVAWRSGDSTLSWLPLYHDMGLVGAALTTIAVQGDLYLMRPDQFIRDPQRWVDGLATVQHTVAPSFGFGYAARRLTPSDVATLDLSGLRSVISGAEPIGCTDVSEFVDLVAGTGFDTACLRPAYGLAESTLMATMATAESSLLAVHADAAAFELGSAVEITKEIRYTGQELDGPGWIIGLGTCDSGSSLRIIDSQGRSLADATLGEVALCGPSIAAGYQDASGATDEASTRFVSGELRTGDAGFVYRGQLFVLGRIGTSVKVRGKSVFMEDVDARISDQLGIAKHRLAAVAAPGTGSYSTIVLFVEKDPGDWLSTARDAVRAELGPGREPTIITGPRGMILRTSSGKPRRRAMWEQLHVLGDGNGITVHDGRAKRAKNSPESTAGSSGSPASGRRAATALLSDGEIEDLLAVALDQTSIHPRATIVLEGSIAEGFGNSGSDIDFLAVSPGDEVTPEMPTVLFIGGRRVEVRTRSEQQLRDQFDYVRRSADENFSSTQVLELNQDVLNRCQRFLRSWVIRDGEVDVNALRGELPYEKFVDALSIWWRLRAKQSLRQGIAFAVVQANTEAAQWLLDGITQAVKAWAATLGETYLETKWIHLQLDRIGDSAVRDRFLALGEQVRTHEVDIDAMCAFAKSIGSDVEGSAESIRFTRAQGIVSWPIDGRIHVLRDRAEVLVLADTAAVAWRHIVFGHGLVNVVARAEGHHGDIAEFIRLGLVKLAWKREPIVPAVAMVKPHKAYTPPASRAVHVVGLAGGARDEGMPVTLNPLPAKRFVECAASLVWSNVIVENAREDLVGALSHEQYGVADVAADRLIKGAVRMMFSVLGISPLPPDVAPWATLDRLMPIDTPCRSDLLSTLDRAQSVRFHIDTARGGVDVLDELVRTIRTAASLRFPASFDSRAQWKRTLEITYDWLRMVAFLNAELPIDEAQDLLANGGAQPHQRQSSDSGKRIRMESQG